MAPQHAMKVGDAAGDAGAGTSPRSGRSLALTVAAAVVVFTTTGLFVLTSSSTIASSAISVVNEYRPQTGSDCRCAGTCPAVPGADGLHYCSVVPSDTCDNENDCFCVGINNRRNKVTNS